MARGKTDQTAGDGTDTVAGTVKPRRRRRAGARGAGVAGPGRGNWGSHSQAGFGSPIHGVRNMLSTARMFGVTKQQILTELKDY